MQHLKAGDFVSFQHNDRSYYFLILGGPAFFGCQWTWGFHKTTDKLDESLVPERMGFGFIALVDFIEQRRANVITKLKSKCSVESYLAFDCMRARIKQPDGRFLWYIYDRNFGITQTQNTLLPNQRNYPIASGLKAKEACDLIDIKWKNDQVFESQRGGQYGFIKDLIK